PILSERLGVPEVVPVIRPLVGPGGWDPHGVVDEGVLTGVNHRVPSNCEVPDHTIVESVGSDCDVVVRVLVRNYNPATRGELGPDVGNGVPRNGDPLRAPQNADPVAVGVAYDVPTDDDVLRPVGHGGV